MKVLCGRADFGTLALAVGGAMLVYSNTSVSIAAWKITLVNQTGHELTVYEVNPNPPPARVPGGTVPDGGSVAIDPDGFNPVMFAWDAGISKTGTAPNGLYIGLDLKDVPPLILCKVFHYKVVPGTAGKKPALQPIQLDDELFTVAEGPVVLVVDGNWAVTLGAPSVGGGCCASAGVCSNIAYANQCAKGTFLPGISCGPNVCGSGTGTVGAGGGTVTSSDGKASITFPKNCLKSDTKITIKEAGWPQQFTSMVLQYPQSGTAYVSYTFDPHMLEFCPGAKLCMSMNLSQHGLGSAACSKLNFFHKDKVCTHGAYSTQDKQCNSDADCGTGGKCGFRFHPHVTKCTCTMQGGQLIARCCTNPKHFSGFGLVLLSQPIQNIYLYPIIFFLVLVLLGGVIFAGRRRRAGV
ncbi:MAG: hypothetical protein PVI86_04140 [Phycisphaerae bacterium]